MRRFVVQEHTVRPGDVHFDLMVEDGATLVTFRLDAPPGAAGAPPVRGRRSFDHRPRYLEHEGPIGGDRGAVRIWARGRAEDLEGGPRAPRWRARVEGDRLAGLLVVTGATATEGAEVQVELEPAGASSAAPT